MPKEIKNPDEPIGNYDHLMVDEIARRLKMLSRPEVEKVKRYEQSHKRRTSLIDRIDSHLRATEPRS